MEKYRVDIIYYDQNSDIDETYVEDEQHARDLFNVFIGKEVVLYELGPNGYEEIDRRQGPETIEELLEAIQNGLSMLIEDEASQEAS